MELTASNRLIQPPDVIIPVGNGIIVKDTQLFCMGDSSEGGILIPTVAGDKKYGIGEVVAVGPKCVEVKEGDCVVFQIASGAGMDPIPNGTKYPDRFKLVETSLCIVCRIPKEKVDAEKARKTAEANAAAGAVEAAK